jgi:hypothetical protein
VTTHSYINTLIADRVISCAIRYLAEFQNGDVRKDSAAEALEAYSSASQIATSDLPPTHPIRLGLALNFSVFYYEILNSPDRACHLAKQVLALLFTLHISRVAFTHGVPLLSLFPANLGFRRRHRRAGHPVRGVVQGQHADHAAAARQPHPVDLGPARAGRRR